MEFWREISSHPDYQVSSLGRVKRVKPDRHGRGLGRLIKPILSNNGYLVVSLHHNTRQCVRLVHRLVCEAFHGLPPYGYQACHNDGNRHNNTPENLRWASPSENNLDKRRHGTLRVGAAHHANTRPACMPRGEAHGNAKLSAKSIAAIRADHRSQRVIADDYGVSQSLISMVKTKAIWAHIEE